MSFYSEFFKQISAEAQDRIKSKSKQQSEYTADLRKRLTNINETSEEFMKVFGDFSEKKLPKDDLYYSIKNEMEAKEKELDKKKKKGQSHFNNNPNAPILPTVHKDNIEKIKADAHRKKVEQAIRELDGDPEYKAIGRPKTPKMVEHHKQLTMAF